MNTKFTYKGHEVEIEGPVKQKNDHQRWIITIDGEQVYRSCLGDKLSKLIAKQLIDQAEAKV